jgi:hypothetical protein
MSLSLFSFRFPKNVAKIKKEARFGIFRATISRVYDNFSIDRFFKKCANSIEKRAHFLDESPEKKIRNFQTPPFRGFPLTCAQWWMDPTTKIFLRHFVVSKTQLTAWPLVTSA